MATNIKARKKLSELYVTGKAIRFGPNGARYEPFADDDVLGENEVEVWIQPPGPLQREMALRDANATRAKGLLRVRRDPESEESLTANAFVSEMSEDTLVEYLLEFDSDRRRNEAIRDVLENEEWKDISGLQDAMRPYEEGELEPDENDPDYKALLDADFRYGDQVYQRTVEIAEADRMAMKLQSRTTLERRAIEKRAELVGSQLFVSEYERQMCFYAVRDPEDHGVLFFESVREYASQPDQVRMAVTTTLAEFLSDTSDPKELPEGEGGSTLSAPPSEPGTSEASTPEASTE